MPGYVPPGAYRNYHPQTPGDAGAVRHYASQLRKAAKSLQSVSDDADTWVYFYAEQWDGAWRDKFLGTWNQYITGNSQLNSAAWAQDRSNFIKANPRMARLYDANTERSTGAFQQTIEACNKMADALDQYAHAIDQEIAQEWTIFLDVLIIAASIVVTAVSFGALGPEAAMFDIFVVGATIGGMTSATIDFTNQMVNNIVVNHDSWGSALGDINMTELENAYITGFIVGGVSSVVGMGLPRVLTSMGGVFKAAAGNTVLRIGIEATGFGAGTFAGDIAAQEIVSLDTNLRLTPVDLGAAGKDALFTTAGGVVLGGLMHGLGAAGRAPDAAGGVDPTSQQWGIGVTTLDENGGKVSYFAISDPSGGPDVTIFEGSPTSVSREVGPGQLLDGTTLVANDGSLSIDLTKPNTDVLAMKAGSTSWINVGADGTPVIVKEAAISDGSMKFTVVPGDRPLPTDLSVDPSTGDMTVPKDWRIVSEPAAGRVTLTPPGSGDGYTFSLRDPAAQGWGGSDPKMIAAPRGAGGGDDPTLGGLRPNGGAGSEPSPEFVVQTGDRPVTIVDGTVVDSTPGPPIDAASGSGGPQGTLRLEPAASSQPVRPPLSRAVPPSEGEVEPMTPELPATPVPPQAAQGAGGGRLIPQDVIDAWNPQFKPAGPLVQVPANESGAPARGLEIAAGPSNTDVGMPPDFTQGAGGAVSVPDPRLVDLTRTDIVGRPGVTVLDATQPIPPALHDQDFVILNNPHGFNVDIANIGQALRAGGRMIIQGRAEVVPGMRPTNPVMNRLLEDVRAGRVPKGFAVVEVLTDPTVPGGRAGDPTVVPKPDWVLGGLDGPFHQTSGGRVTWPNTRIVIERLADPTATPPAVVETTPASGPSTVTLVNPTVEPPVRPLRSEDPAVQPEASLFGRGGSGQPVPNQDQIVQALQQVEGLKPDVWKTLDPGQRVTVLQQVESTVADIQGRPPMRVEPAKLDFGTLGQYDPATGTIKVNEVALSHGTLRDALGHLLNASGSEQSILETLLHEGRHAYQDFAIANPGFEVNSDQVNAWRDNWAPGNYQEPSVWNPVQNYRYWAQPLEADARTFEPLARQVLEGMTGPGQIAGPPAAPPDQPPARPPGSPDQPAQRVPLFRAELPEPGGSLVPAIEDMRAQLAGPAVAASKGLLERVMEVDAALRALGTEPGATAAAERALASLRTTIADAGRALDAFDAGHARLRAEIEQARSLPPEQQPQAVRQAEALLSNGARDAISQTLDSARGVLEAGEMRLHVEPPLTPAEVRTQATQAAVETLRTEQVEVRERLWHEQQLQVARADPADRELLRQQYAEAHRQLVHQQELASVGLRILSYITEWDPLKGGVVAVNRNLCLGLAEAGHEVFVRVGHEVPPGLVEGGVHVIGPRTFDPGLDERFQLLGPEGLPSSVDVVIGHSRFSGPAALQMHDERFPDARLVHVVHMVTDALGRVQGRPEFGLQNQAIEADLVAHSDLAVGVGPVLRAEVERLAAMTGSTPGFHELVPGVPFEEPLVPSGDRTPNILLFGRADDAQKGALEAAMMVHDLPPDVRLTVRGAPPETVERARARLSQVAGRPVDVRPYTIDRAEILADMRDADVVIMPSRAEGFGLVGLEAAGAGVPILVPSTSGVGRFVGDASLFPPDVARHSVVEQGFEEPVPIDRWVARLRDVLADPGEARRLALELRLALQEQNRTWRGAAESLIAAVRALEDRPASRPATPGEEEPRSGAAG